MGFYDNGLPANKTGGWQLFGMHDFTMSDAFQRVRTSALVWMRSRVARRCRLGTFTVDHRTFAGCRASRRSVGRTVE